MDGRILEANDAFLRMVGYDREDLVGRPHALDGTDAAGVARAGRNWLWSIKTTGSAPPIEKEYFRKDGSRVPVMLGSATH